MDQLIRIATVELAGFLAARLPCALRQLVADARH